MKKVVDWAGYELDPKDWLVVTQDEPILNRSFRVLGAQMIDISGKPLETIMVEKTADESSETPYIYKGVETIHKWKSFIKALSDSYVDITSRLTSGRILIKDAKRFIVKFSGQKPVVMRGAVY